MQRRKGNKGKKKGNKKRGGKKGGSGGPNGGVTSVQNSKLTGFDPRFIMTLKYCEEVNFSVTTGIGAQYLWNLNSVFDPYRTSTGHQPLDFDTIAVKYTRYRVHRVRWKVTFGSSTTTFKTVVCPMNGLLNAAITTVATFQNAMEQQRAVNKAQSGAGGDAIVHRGSVELYKLAGVSRQVYNSDDMYQALVTADPAEVMTLVVGLYNENAATVVETIQMELEYLVEFSDPIASAPSLKSAKQIIDRVEILEASRLSTWPERDARDKICSLDAMLEYEQTLPEEYMRWYNSDGGKKRLSQLQSEKLAHDVKFEKELKRVIAALSNMSA